MPARQPFTALCQAAARSRADSSRPFFLVGGGDRARGRADLHLHTTHSDGAYSPAQIIDLAVRSGLAAVAITDHDTLSGVREARTAAAGTVLEVIAGVEITAEHRGQELHLLGYFVSLDDGHLLAALERLRQHRVGRFWDMAKRLRACGVNLDDEELRVHAGSGVLGRRHLAEFLVKIHHTGSVREAFSRYLNDKGRATVPKTRLPVAEAISLVRGAGGVASWAHPFYDCSRQNLVELAALGLGAVEVEFPGVRRGRIRQLRSWASELGLAVTAGSDCHGPDYRWQAVGMCSVTADELAGLRQLALC